MILVDWQIKQLCEKGMIAPFEEGLVNPASMDVRLGRFILVEAIIKEPRAFRFDVLRQMRVNKHLIDKIEAIAGRAFPVFRTDWVKIDLDKYSEADPFLLEPKEFILAQTEEIFDIPLHVAAEFKMKSSRAREGYNNVLATWCDPGWHGSALTLELINENRSRGLPLYRGLKIGQMIFHRLDGIPDECYKTKGRYNGDTQVQGSRG